MNIETVKRRNSDDYGANRRRSQYPRCRGARRWRPAGWPLHCWTCCPACAWPPCHAGSFGASSSVRPTRLRQRGCGLMCGAGDGDRSGGVAGADDGDRGGVRAPARRAERGKNVGPRYHRDRRAGARQRRTRSCRIRGRMNGRSCWPRWSMWRRAGCIRCSGGPQRNCWPHCRRSRFGRYRRVRRAVRLRRFCKK